MFTDVGCTGSAGSAHALASTTRCDGIPILADGDFSSGDPEWCGEPGDWAGLLFGGDTAVNCVLVTGSAVSLALTASSSDSSAGMSWSTVQMWPVLTESGGVVTAQLRLPKLPYCLFPCGC